MTTSFWGDQVCLCRISYSIFLCGLCVTISYHMTDIQPVMNRQCAPIARGGGGIGSILPHRRAWTKETSFDLFYLEVLTMQFPYGYQHCPWWIYSEVWMYLCHAMHTTVIKLVGVGEGYMRSSRMIHCRQLISTSTGFSSLSSYFITHVLKPCHVALLFKAI